jgi:uncharacterized protein
MNRLAASCVSLPRRALIVLVQTYRLLLSPWLGSGCRFEPTCSVYSLHALNAYGAAAGSYLTLRRLARCHPWCSGGHDPLPTHAPALFRRFADGTQRTIPSPKPEPSP